MYKCQICDNLTNLKEYTVLERMCGTNEKFVYFCCPNCGCLQIKDLPADMNKYYGTKYYSKSENFLRFVGLKKIVFKSALNNGIIYKIISFLTPFTKLNFLKFFPQNKDISILDIGCGSGSILYYLKEAGYKKCTGIDSFLDKDILNYKNGLNIYRKKLSELGEKFDVIMLHHSFEHMPDPKKTLLEIKTHLKEKGVCIIRIPVADSFAWEHFKKDWFQIDAPRHLFLHTKKSMKILSQKTDLKIFSIFYDSSAYQFIRSQQNQKGGWASRENNTKIKKLVNMLLAPYYNLKASKLNKLEKGDQAGFILTSDKF